MTLGTVPEETLLPHGSEHQSQEIIGLNSSSSRHNISQAIEVLSHQITSDAPKLLSNRSIYITFYDPLENPFFSIKDTNITAETQLKDLVVTLQNLLDKTIAAEPTESLLVKKILFRDSIQQLCDRFPSHISHVKGNSGGQILNRKVVCDHVEEMGISWTEIRDVILIDDESFIQRNGTPILEVYTIHKDLNAQPDPTAEVKDAYICKHEIATPSKPSAGWNYSIIVGSLGIFQIPNESVRDKNELGFLKTAIDENKDGIRQHDGSEGKDSRNKEIVEGNLNEKIVTKRNTETLDSIERRKKKEEKEKKSTDSFDKFPSLVKSHAKEKSPSYSHTSFPIKSPRERGEKQEVRGLNKAKATLYLENLDRNKFTTSHWSNRNNSVEDGFCVQDVYIEDKMPLTTESGAGRLTPKLKKELEIYRRSHESAVSYANEDEEAFFPSTPLTAPIASTTRGAQSLFNENRQMTQLDLDKIVKDAVVRKMNRSRNANPDNLISLEGNWNNDVIMDQLVFHSPRFTQDLSYNQEYVEFPLGENVHTGNLDDSREIMGGKDDPRSPMYYTSPYDQTNTRMSGINADMPHFMMNSFVSLEAESFSHMNQNLNFINGGMDGYANGDYNTANLFDVAGGNSCAPTSSGGYFMDHGRQNGLDCGKNHPTRFFNNQMKFQDQFAWNRAYTNGVY